MLVEFKFSGDIINFNYKNPVLKYYCPEKNVVINNYKFKDKIDSCNFIFDAPYFYFIKDSLNQIIVPSSPRFEIYYLSQDGSYYFFDSYFEAVNFLKNTQIDNDELYSFHTKMSCRSGNTLHRHIKRLIPGKKYFLNNDILIFEDYIPIENANLNYSDFKKRFESFIKSYSEGKDIAILLSGGVDSTAIALAASKFSKSTRTYTMRYLPLQSGTEGDAVIAKRTSNDNNWKHKVIDIDFRGNISKLINVYSSHIPLVCGLPHGYNGLLKLMKSDNVEVAFTGENADKLTYFGATAEFKFNREGLSAFIRRLFLSKYYCRYFYKKESYKNKFLSSFIYLLGYLITLFYSFYKKNKYRQPQNIKEFFLNSLYNPDILPFVDISKLKIIENQKLSFNIDLLSPDNFHYYLIREKLGTDMMISDSQIIRVAGKLNEILVHFPFSSNLLVYFFMNRELGINSLLNAKSFIKKYVLENYPKYSKKVNIVKKEKSLNPHEWASELLKNGNITKNITDQIVRTPFMDLYFQVSKLWHQNVIFLLKNKK